MMRKRVIILVATVLVLLSARGLYYYGGVYTAPPMQVHIPAPAVTPLLPSEAETEHRAIGPQATGEEAESAATEETTNANVLIDVAHGNALDTSELSVLIGGLAMNDARVVLLSDQEMDDALADADSMVVICPQYSFSPGELDTIEDFVDAGGRLLLVGDPTRPSAIDTVSIRFGLVFDAGYLYNLVEHDVNFRNILVSDFKEHSLTAGLDTIALYTAGSIAPGAWGIAFADGETSSTALVESELCPMALTEHGNVLALHDLTFMTPPYNSILDNNALVENIAVWLTAPYEEEAPATDEAQEQGDDS